MKQAWVTACALAMALSTLANANCGTSGVAMARPTAELGTTSARRAAFGDLVLRSVISVHNPNKFAVELVAIDWELKVDGAASTNERSMFRERIPAKGSKEVEFGRKLPAGTAVHITSRIAVGAKSYRLSGTLHFSSPHGERIVPFDFPGVLE